MTKQSTTETAVAVLTGARDSLAESGWTQNVAMNRDGNMCLIRAIEFGAQAYFYDIDAWRLSYGSIREKVIAAGFATVSEWNDTPGRTVEEVNELLTKTITDLESK